MTTDAPIFPYAKFYAYVRCNRCGAVYPTTLNHTCILDMDMAAIRERAEKAEAELLSAREALAELARGHAEMVPHHMLPDLSACMPDCRGCISARRWHAALEVARALSPSPKGTPPGEDRHG